MKKSILALAVLAVAMGATQVWAGGGCCSAAKPAAAGAGCGAKTMSQPAGGGVQAVSPASASEVKAQVNCPVMGGAAKKDVYVDHNGKRVYFCCNACVETFKADPEKYVKKLTDEGVTLEDVPAAE